MDKNNEIYIHINAKLDENSRIQNTKNKVMNWFSSKKSSSNKINLSEPINIDKEILTQVQNSTNALTEACSALKECINGLTKKVENNAKTFQDLLETFQKNTDAEQKQKKEEDVYEHKEGEMEETK